MNLAFQVPGGNVGIGTPSPTSLLTLYKANNPTITFQDTEATSYSIIRETCCGGLTFQGNVSFFKINENGSTISGSDRRLKKNISTLENVLDRVTQLRPVRYQMKSEPDGAAKNIGFIAQEVEPLFPEFVSEANGYKGVAYANMVAVAVGAIKELNLVVQQQQTELNEKSARLDALEKQMGDLKKTVAQLAEANKAVKLAEKTESPAHTSAAKRVSLVTASRDQ